MPTRIGNKMYTEVNERIAEAHSKDKDGNGVSVGCSIDTDIVWLKEPDIQDEIKDALESIKDAMEGNADLIHEASNKDVEALTSAIEGYTRVIGSLESEIKSVEQAINNRNREILMKSTVRIADHTFTGYAHEKEVPFDPKRRNQDVNTTSFIENCETSARGRALGAAGIGITEAVASADEVRNAQAQGQHNSQRSGESQKQTGLDSIRNRVFALYKKHQASFESQGIDYWGSVKVIFEVGSRSEMTAPQWERLIKLTQDTENWTTHFRCLVEPDTEQPDEIEEPQF